MKRKTKAFAALEPRGELEPFEFNSDELRAEQVEIKVLHWGICHSDLSMRDNEWQMTVYPFVPGHEAVGKIVAKHKSEQFDELTQFFKAMDTLYRSGDGVSSRLGGCRVYLEM